MPPFTLSLKLRNGICKKCLEVLLGADFAELTGMSYVALVICNGKQQLPS